jgi:hypothetical protein
MGTYKTKSCPKCGNVFEMFAHVYAKIGKPFRECEKCKSLCLDTDTTEWDLKGPLGKASYIFLSSLGSILLGWLVPLALFAFGLSKWIGMEPNSFTVLGSWGLGVLMFGALNWSSVHKEIRASQERMSDPHYRECLRALGILTK